MNRKIKVPVKVNSTEITITNITISNSVVIFIESQIFSLYRVAFIFTTNNSAFIFILKSKVIYKLNSNGPNTVP